MKGVKGKDLYNLYITYLNIYNEGWFHYHIRIIILAFSSWLKKNHEAIFMGLLKVLWTSGIASTAANGWIGLGSI